MSPSPSFKNYLSGGQVAVTIMAFVLLGRQLDLWLKTQNNIFLIILSFFSILYALYRLIKDVNKDK